MTDEIPDEYFVDFLSNVTHANGVFRLTFSQQELENTSRPVVRLLVPVNQMQRILQGIVGAAREIQDRIEQSRADAPDAETIVATEPDAPQGRSRKRTKGK